MSNPKWHIVIRFPDRDKANRFYDLATGHQDHRSGPITRVSVSKHSLSVGLESKVDSACSTPLIAIAIQRFEAEAIAINWKRFNWEV